MQQACHAAKLAMAGDSQNVMHGPLEAPKAPIIIIHMRASQTGQDPVLSPKKRYNKVPTVIMLQLLGSGEQRWLSFPPSYLSSWKLVARSALEGLHPQAL